MPARVLIVDDDESLRAVLRDVLEDRGYTVDVAVDGPDALDRLQVSPPDVIILDLLMPVMDGWSFIAEARKAAAGTATPIIVLSAVRSLFDATANLRVRGVLSKPFDMEVLLTYVARAVAEESARR